MVAVTRALAPVLATVVLLGLLVAWAPGATADGPEVTLSTAQASIGESIAVEGEGWPRGEEVTLSVCQDPGGRNALTCAPSSLGVPVSWDGHFRALLEVVAPEGGCPCVVAVDGPSVPPVTRDLRIATGDGTSLAAPDGLVIEGARLVGGRGMGTWFGGAPDPDLELTVHNGGTARAEMSLRLHWRDGLEEAVAVPVSPIEALGPGETRTVVVPLTFDSWSQGGHTVEGTLTTEETVLPFKASMTVAPWGLYAVVVLALASAAGWRNRWLFTPQVPDGEADPELDEDLEARALSLIEGHASLGSAPRVPRQAAEREPARESRRTPAREPEADPSWVPMDPVEMIERSTTVSVPRQRREPGGRRAERSSRLKDRVGGIRRR